MGTVKVTKYADFISILILDMVFHLTMLHCLQMKVYRTTDIKQNGINRYEYDLLVGFGNIDVDDTLDIHKYLTKKNDIK